MAYSETMAVAAEMTAYGLSCFFSAAADAQTAAEMVAEMAADSVKHLCKKKKSEYRSFSFC